MVAVYVVQQGLGVDDGDGPDLINVMHVGESNLACCLENGGLGIGCQGHHHMKATECVAAHVTAERAERTWAAFSYL